MPKHIPGNPAIFVENMPGAASLVATNYLYRAAKPDGLTIGNFVGGMNLQQLLGAPGIEFDGAKFDYLGAPAQDNFTIGLASALGINSVDQWIASGRVVKLGGVAPGGGTDDFPKLLKAVLGLPLQLVSGYKGTGPVRLAFEAGEVEGACNSWESFRATWRRHVESRQVVIVLQATVRRHPELPQVPTAYELAKTVEAKNMIQALAAVHGATNRVYALPPGTPQDRLSLLRKAFVQTMKDPELLAEAKKAQLDINPLDGEEVERHVKALFKLDRAVVDRLREILK